jgi:CheY-like chemotaxis protein
MVSTMARANSARIVVIDDHPEHLDYLATLLRRAGYEVTAHTAAADAMDALKRWPAHLVVTDVFMPHMDGFEVLRTLKLHYPELPLIAIGGAFAPGGQSMLPFMRKLGASDTFTKPIDTAALLKSVATLVGAACDAADDPRATCWMAMHHRAAVCRRLAMRSRNTEVTDALLKLVEEFEPAGCACIATECPIRHATMRVT